MRTLRVFSVPILILALPLTALSQGGPPSVLFHGTEMTALGAAQLAVGPAATANPLATARTHDHLVVSNIGASGDDGFEAMMGGSQGGRLWIDPGTPLPTDGEFWFESLKPGAISPCVRVQNLATGVVITPDFTSQGASTYFAEVWNDGVFVEKFTGLTGVMTASAMPDGFGADIDAVSGVEPVPFADGEGVRHFWIDDAILEHTASGGSATGDELRLFPENTSGAPNSIVSMRLRVRVPAAMAPFTLECTDFAQLKFGHLHRAFGGAQLLSSADPMPAAMRASRRADHSEIGFLVPPATLSTIQIDLEPVEAEDCVIWDIKDSGGNGDTDEFSVQGELTAGGSAEIARVMSTYSGAGWMLAPDFTGSGASTYDVEAYDDMGNLIAQASGQTADISVTTTDYANELGVGNDRISLTIGYPAQVSMDIPGIGLVTAKHIVVRSPNKLHDFFRAAKRRVFSNTGATLSMIGVPNALDLQPDVVNPNPLNPDYVRALGTAYAARCHDCLVIGNIGSSGDAGAAFCPPVGINFPNLEWVYPGTPAQNTAQTDWDFVTRLQGQSTHTTQMSLGMRSDGTQVNMTIDPGQSSTPFYEITLKLGGVVVAQYIPPDPIEPFAHLPDWPIGIGYHVLVTPNEPWQMHINLGQEMDVVLPGGPTAASANAAAMPTKADLIEILAKDTAAPALPIEGTMLKMRVATSPRWVFKTDGAMGPIGIGPTRHAVSTVLHAAYPNPFNPTTRIAFDLGTSGPVTLSVYAVDGSYVATLHDGVLVAGPHDFTWNGRNHLGQPVTSGVYFVNLVAPDGAANTKVSFLK